MRFSILTAALLVTSALANPLVGRTGKNDDHDNEGGLKVICRHLKTKDKGCVRYVKGFDVTGILTEIINPPNTNTLCDCIEYCIRNRKKGCANYVWKFAQHEGVPTDRRVCTLYSDFNLPLDVKYVIDLDDKNNQNIIPSEFSNLTADFVHEGASVPQAKDAHGKFDPRAVSGPVWDLETGDVLC